MDNNIQKISSYISGKGLKVYEILQYNKELNEWFIVGDCSVDKEYIWSLICNHNFHIELKKYIEK